MNEAPVSVLPLSIAPCEEILEGSFLDSVGARAWDRDPTDQRIVDDVVGGTGRIIDTPPDMNRILNQASTEHELILPDDPSSLSDAGTTRLEGFLQRLRQGLSPEDALEQGED